jgi:perosamine synthetase
MNKCLISHNAPTLGKQEARATQKVLESGWLAQGEEVKAFEDEFCDFVGLPSGHAVAVSSGSAGLFLALSGIGVENKKVLLPSYVCSAVKHSITLAGGKPVFADNIPDSANMDFNNTTGEFDFAVAVHSYGIPLQLETLDCSNIIEDCCQSLGSMIDGHSVGLKGRFGVFSFYATKLITSGGQGGMIISNSRTEINKIKDLRDFDMKIDNVQRFNLQMTDLQASIGRVQLAKCKGFINRRKEILKKYIEAGLPLQAVDYENSNGYRAILRVKDPTSLKIKFDSYGIKTIIPIEEQELLHKLPNAADFCSTSLSIPIYPTLSDDQVQFVIDKFYES